MSFSMNKLKSLMPTKTEHCIYKNKKQIESLEPVVGFKLILEPSGSAFENGCSVNGPELQVHLAAARHLPSKFGMKSVEGYQIKVKLFPGSLRYESNIQTTSWPRYNEVFRFPMVSPHKSSFKSKHKYKKDVNGNDGNMSLPEKLFKGTFVVLTVIAILELPQEDSGLKATYKALKRQGSLMIRDRTNLNIFSNSAKPAEPNIKKNSMRLVTSESQRNIGSVTCFLDPKIFEENKEKKFFSTQELWLPIRDITVTPTKDAKLNVACSLKGQVEIILELTEENVDYGKADFDPFENQNNLNNNTNPFEEDDVQPPPSTSASMKHRFSLSDVRRMIKINRKGKISGLCLKITTSKMRSSIKVKEEFENVTNQLYVKTTVFEHNILSASWKSQVFVPSISTRWENSTIIVPLVNEESLQHVSIKVTLATKTKMGKKLVLGTVYVGPEVANSLEHWQSMATMKFIAMPAWYNFE